MMKNLSLITLLIIVVTSLTFAPADLQAEQWGKKSLEGYFTETRWDIPMFIEGHRHYIVAYPLADKLRQYKGKPISISLTKFSQQMDDCIVLQEASRQKPFGMEQYPPASLSLSIKPKRRQVMEGQGIELTVSVTNNSKSAQVFNPAKLAIVLVTNNRGGFTPKIKTSKHTTPNQSYSFSYIPNYETSTSGEWLDFAFRQFMLPYKPNCGTSGEGWTAAKGSNRITIKPGGCFEQTITGGKDFIPGEYEVFTYYTPDRSATAPGPMSQRLPFDIVTPVTLRGLLFVDMHAPNANQHPLLASPNTIYPGGREFIFRQPSTNAVIHAVCPKGIHIPRKQYLAKPITLHGRYKTITEEQRKRIWKFKNPGPNYKYFLISAWGYKKQHADTLNKTPKAVLKKIAAKIEQFNKEILPPTGTTKAYAEAVFGPPSHIGKSGKFGKTGQTIHVYKLLPGPNKEMGRASLVVKYRDDKVWQAGINHLCVSKGKIYCNTDSRVWNSSRKMLLREKLGQLENLAAIKEKYKTKLTHAPWHKTTK